jgi:hypothetical protein
MGDLERYYYVCGLVLETGGWKEDRGHPESSHLLEKKDHGLINKSLYLFNWNLLNTYSSLSEQKNVEHKTAHIPASMELV